MINTLVYKTVLIKLNEEYLGEPGVKVEIILRRILKEQEVGVRTGLIWVWMGPVEGSCEHSKDP
jgi:hypothetical protein